MTAVGDARKARAEALTEQRVSHHDPAVARLIDEAVAARDAEWRSRITALADEWERQMAAGSLQVAPWVISEVRDLMGDRGSLDDTDPYTAARSDRRREVVARVLADETTVQAVIEAIADHDEYTILPAREGRYAVCDDAFCGWESDAGDLADCCLAHRDHVARMVLATLRSHVIDRIITALEGDEQ